MKLAVIDTNVIIAAHITKHDDSATRKIIRAVSDGTVVPIVTPAILSEYAEVMSRTKFKIEPETVAATIRYFRERGKNVMPVAYSRNLPDDKDRAFLEAALALFDDGAVLVTGNKRHFPNADFILTPSEFVEVLNAQT